MTKMVVSDKLYFLDPWSRETRETGSGVTFITWGGERVPGSPNKYYAIFAQSLIVPRNKKISRLTQPKIPTQCQH